MAFTSSIGSYQTWPDWLYTSGQHLRTCNDQTILLHMPFSRRRSGQPNVSTTTKRNKNTSLQNNRHALSPIVTHTDRQADGAILQTVVKLHTQKERSTTREKHQAEVPSTLHICPRLPQNALRVKFKKRQDALRMGNTLCLIQITPTSRCSEGLQSRTLAILPL